MRRWSRVMVKTWVHRSSNSSVTGWLRNERRSMPSSESAATAGWLADAPLGAFIPAERMVISVRSRRKFRMSPSAMGLRQTFPVQTKRMVFMTRVPLCSSGMTSALA